MRTTCTLVLVLVLFFSSCYGLRSDELTHKGNAENNIDGVKRAADKQNDTTGDNDTKHSTTSFRQHHATGTTRETKTLDVESEERGLFDLFKFKNPLRKNHAPKVSSQKNLASDTMITIAQKNPASTRLVGILGKNQPTLTEKDVSFIKSNPVFGKLKAVFAKNPAQLSKKDVQLMGQNPGLSKAKSLLGNDPTKQDFKRVGTYLSKNRGNPEKYWGIFYGLICLAVLGLIVGFPIVALSQ